MSVVPRAAVVSCSATGDVAPESGRPQDARLARTAGHLAADLAQGTAEQATDGAR